MTSFTRSDDLQGAEFVDTDLSGARFVGADLSEVVMRGIEIRAAEIDAPWLPDGDNVLLVNGVDVIPYVEAELDRRFPGREQRRATDPEGLRSAWAVLEQTWAATVQRVGIDARGNRRRLDGRRVVVRPDAASPGDGHRRLASASDPGDRPALPSPRTGLRRRGRTSWISRSSPPSSRRTARSSRSEPAASRWFATSSPP